MEELQKLYDVLARDGYYTKSFEEFQVQYEDPTYRDKVFEVATREGLYTKSREEFDAKYSLKKKDGTADSTVVEEVTESASPPSPELGLSVPSAPDDPELLGAYEDTPVTPPQEGVAVADPNLVGLQEGESVYDANERVAVALAAEDDAKDQRSEFDRSLDILDKRQHEQDTKLGLNFKDRDYTDRPIGDLEEEEVVGEMRYHFGDYGFKFEEFGLRDNMRVTAPNGEALEISLDNWDAEQAREVNEAETKKLKKFMQQHKPIEKTGLDRIESEALGNERKILGKKDYEERLLSMTTKTGDLKDKIKDFTARKIASDKLGKNFSRMSRSELSRNQEAYNQWLAEDTQLKTEGDILEGDIDGMKTQGKQLDGLVGKYMAMRSEEGSFMGGLWNSGWEGFGQIFSTAYGIGVDAVSMSMPQGYRDIWAKHAKGLDRGGGEYNEFSQAASGYMSQDRKGIQRLIRERGTAVAQSQGSGVSKEYTDAAGFVEGALYGTASSVPAMILGLPALVLQGIDMVSKETENNPLFEGISELEKLSIAAPIGIVMGWLEKVGLTKAIAGTSTLSKVTLGALKKFGVSPTTRTFSEFVEFEVAHGGKRALLKFMSSGAAEFETGALQEANDIIMKKIYNELKGQDLFQSPESFGEALLQIGEGAVAEAIGGFALGTPGAVVSGVLKGNLGAISDDTFSVFEALMSNSESKTAYIESIKQKIVAGKITKTEGQRQIEEAENVMGVMSQIPTNYTPAQKKKALGLLLRRAKLQEEVDKGDKQLVTKQQTEIDVINEQLQNLETEETTTEVEEATTEEAIEALEAEDAIMEKMTGKPTATLRTPKVVEKKRQELTKQRQDAIQKSGAKSVDVQEQARDGKTMGEGDPLGGPTSESVQETEDVTSEDPAEQAEIDILSSLFGEETTEEGGETTAAVEVGEKVKVETPEGGEVEGQKLGDKVGMIQTPGAKTAKTVLQKAIIKLATRGAKSIAKILPNTKIIIHESVDSFKKLGGIGKGFYNPTTDAIHINLSTASLGTIAHETFHAILFQKLGIDANIQLATKEMLDTVMETITDKKVLERLEKFRLLYERASLESGKKASQLQEKYNQLAEAQEVAPTPEGQAQLDSLLQQIEEATNESTSFEDVLQEEQLAELTAILAEHYAEANSATQNAIVKWLKKLAQTLNLSPVIIDQVFNNKGNKSAQNQAVIDLLNTIARKTVLGEEITETDIETIEQYAEPTDKKVAPETGAKETAKPKKGKAKKSVTKKTLAKQIEEQENIIEELEEDRRDQYGIWQSTADPRDVINNQIEGIVDPETAKIIKKIKQAEKKLAGLKAKQKGKTKHQLDLSSPEAFIDNEIRKPLEGDGTFAHMTAENPGNKTLSAEENAQRNEEVREVLEEKGYEFIEVDGKYNRDEKSFFVKDISVEDAIDIGVQFGQESVSHSAGMLYTTGENAGKMEPTTGEVSTDPKMENFYSTVHTKEGSQKYQVGYDWGNFVDIPKGGEIKHQLDAEEVKKSVTPGKSIGKGLSVKSVNKETIKEGVDNMSLSRVREVAPKMYIKNANILRGYPIVKGIQKFGEITTLEEADAVYDIFVAEVSDNLNFLHDLFGDTYRERASLWYDGANRIANRLAEKFGATIEQAAGVLAALSPQKDWYQNVRLAEMVFESFAKNPVFTQEMVDFQKDINKRGEALARKRGRTALIKARKRGNQVLALLEQYIGQDLKSVPTEIKPFVVRLSNEVNNKKDYQLISPEGEQVGVVKKKDGTKKKVAWGSYMEIGKAVSIVMDGSEKNISESLGSMHKIRNFYNNISNPTAEDGSVTVDTHAVAAGLLSPLSGNSTEVGQNFGIGAASSGAFGIKGTYFAFADAYIKAAEENGLLPREMQSVTWEAIRGLFPDSYKQQAKNIQAIKKIHNNYVEGKITKNEAREQILSHANGIADPAWARSDVSATTESDGQEAIGERVRRDERVSKRDKSGRRTKRSSKKSVRHQLDDQGNDISKLELDTKYNKSDIIPDSYINNNKISDPLNPAKLPKKKFSVTWEEQSSWGDLLTQERTFNDGQHFVNFWRKATNDGAWGYLSNFTFHTEATPIVRKVQRKDGSWTKIEEIQTTTQPIDIEKLKGWNFKNKVSNPQRLKQSRKFEGSRSKAGKTRRFQLAPNGKPSNLTPQQYELVRTPAFKKWFGNWETDPENSSKVVDENGEPMVVYRGRQDTGDVIDIGKTKEGAFFSDNKKSSDLFMSEFLGLSKDEYNIIETFLDIKTPEVFSDFWNDFISARNTKGLYKPKGGIDGAIIQDDTWLDNRSFESAEDQLNTFMDKLMNEDISEEQFDKKVAEFKESVEDAETGSIVGTGKQFIAFKPNQIKLADSTNTTFSPKSKSIKFQLDVDGPNASIQEIITEGRGAGLKDSSIGSYLHRIKKVPKKIVKKLLEFDIGLFNKLPKSFAEVEGGLLAGVQLFKNIQDFISKETKANTKRTKLSQGELKGRSRAKRKELTKKNVKTSAQMREIKRKIRERMDKRNNFRQTPRPKKEVDAQVNELYEIEENKNTAAKVAVDKAVAAFEVKQEKANAKKKGKLTSQEIMDLAIERLMAHPLYKKLADTRKSKGEVIVKKDPSTLQAEMVIDLQKTLGVRPTQNMRKALTKLRQMVRFRNQGARQLQLAKRELLRFMRQTLPKTAYTKKEAIDLARRVAQATAKDMTGLMHEVIQLSSKKNVGILSRAISKLLKPYETKQSGRVKGTSIDNITRRVVKGIIAHLNNPKATAADVQSRNTELLERFNVLSNQMETTVEERLEMEGLVVAINLNNAMLMEDTDPNKAIALDRAYAALRGLIEGGRSNLKESLAQEKAAFNEDFAKIYEDITGDKIPVYKEDVLDEEGNVIHEKGEFNFEIIDKEVQKKNLRRRRKETHNRLVQGLRGFVQLVKNFFTYQHQLSGLINKISKLPGELFGGITEEQVVDKIDEGTRRTKELNLMMKRAVEGKMEELWGKAWKFKVGVLAKVFKTKVYVDQAAVDKAQKTYDENPTSENKSNLRFVKREQELSMSQNEIYYLYNQFKDPSNHAGFESRFGKDYARIMEELTATLDPETQAFADWQVEEFYPMVYPIYNEIYQKVYKTDMPWNEFYAGPLMREGEVVQDLDLLAGVGSNTAVTAVSTKSRVQNKNKIKEGVDGTAALMFYIQEMNHFAGMAVPINHINKLLLNPTMAKTIEANYGMDILEAIQLSIQRVANKGRIDKGARFVNFVNTAFIMSRLGLNPVVMLKQLTSFVTYANDIGVVNWLRYAATNITQIRKVFKEIKANSVYMDDRAYNNIMKAIETYAPEKVQKFLPAPILNSLMNIAMWTTKFGDKAAIYIGGMPNYSYHKAEFKKKNPGATEQQAIDYAIRKFEKDTKNTQQSADIQNKDLLQTGNPYLRFLNMFMTTPKQYNRRVFGSIGNLMKMAKSLGKEGKGTLISNLRTIGTYHFVMPMFFQWVALGFPLGADWDEEDKEDMKRAAIIGNMNSLFIAGDVISMIADAIQGKPWAFNVGGMPAVTIPVKIGLYIDKAAKAKTPETREKWTRKAMYEGMSFFGIPASNIDKIYNNFIKLSEGGLTEKEAILRALQYSDYVIEGKKDKKKSKTKKPTKKEMKEYFPEQYQRELEMEEMIKEMTYDPEVEALEAEIKAMEDEARREMLEAMRE